MRHCTFTQSILKSINESLFGILIAATILIGISVNSHAQATLSVQGILKKSNGVALEDGTYTIKFNIYAVDGSPGGILWDEINPAVELNGGIYSVVLGEIDPLALAFDQDYELGVQIGTQEMTPRIRLTSAPYALALRGSSNQFPSAGLVLADELKVAQSVLASGGAPGLNGVDKNGYAFSGNSGDNDSGLFSTADGEVSVYVNNVEKLEVTSTGTTTNGTATATTLGANNLNLYSNGGINYSSNQGSFSEWRLADVDDLQSGVDGWQVYDPVSGEHNGWNQSSPTGSASHENYGVFVGNVMEPNNNNQVMKKQFTIAGSFSQIRIKFRYYIIDSWGQSNNDYGFAGFATSVNGSSFRAGWFENLIWMQHTGELNTSAFVTAANFEAGSQTDHWRDIEMSARANGNSFWLFIGAALDEDTNNEKYAVGPIEVWVR